MKPRTLRPYKPGDFQTICRSIVVLREVRDALIEAGAEKSADYVRRAIKSAEGARRHAERCRNERNRALDAHRENGLTVLRP